MRSLILIAGITFAAGLWGQSASMPQRGVVAAGKQSVLRTIYGVPGASVLGEAIQADGLAAVAPGAGYALVTSDQGVALLNLQSPGGEARKLRSRPALITFSPAGASAVFVDESAVEVWTGLPGAPRLAFKQNVEERITSASVSDDAEVVSIAVASGEVYQLSASQTAQRVSGLSAIALVRFLPGSHALLALDSSGQLISTDLAAASIRSVAQVAADANTEVAISLDGRYALLASASGVSFIELTTGLVQPITLERNPTRILAIGADLFAVAGAEITGVWLVDAKLAPAYIPAS